MRDINPLVGSPCSHKGSDHPGLFELLTITREFVRMCLCVRARFTQQMGKKLSLCILIGHLWPISRLPLGQNGSHLITHHDNIITDVQTNKANS